MWYLAMKFIFFAECLDFSIKALQLAVFVSNDYRQCRGCFMFDVLKASDVAKLMFYSCNVCKEQNCVPFRFDTV